MLVSSGSSNVLIFLISTVTFLFVMALMLRFLTQLFRGDFYNPITQFIVKITQPALNILNRFMPRHNRIDFSVIFLAIFVIFIKLFMLKSLGQEQYSISGAILSMQQASVGALIYLAMLELLDFVFDIFFFTIVAQAIMSWLNPATYNPMITFLEGITYPLLNFVRRFVPNVGGIDISPILAIILLIVSKMIIFPSLIQVVKVF
jgi:YggT family protein